MKVKINTILLIAFMLVSTSYALAQNSTDLTTKITTENKRKAEQENTKLPKPYHPKENAELKIASLVQTAKKQNKNIILQAGGNWCIWCLRFNHFLQTDPELKALVDQNFLYYHLNYSPENKNEKLFKKYGNPGEKYGYPVLIILDSKGKRIHTQDSALLEEGNSYSKEKVKEFLQVWRIKK